MVVEVCLVQWPQEIDELAPQPHEGMQTSRSSASALSWDNRSGHDVRPLVFDHRTRSIDRMILGSID